MAFRLHKKKIVEIDEHEMPTEPVPDRILIPIADTPPQSTAGVAAFAPLNMYQPYNYYQPPIYPAAGYSSYTQPGYPGSASQGPTWQPTMPEQSRHPEAPEQSEDRSAAGPSGWQIFWPRAVSIGVGLCFVGVQILLLLRFALKLSNWPVNVTWGAVVNTLSDVVLIPFNALLPPLAQPIFTRVEPYTLLAIIIYGLCSRLIVHLLKIVLGVRFAARPRQ